MFHITHIQLKISASKNVERDFLNSYYPFHKKLNDNPDMFFSQVCEQVYEQRCPPSENSCI